MNSFAHFWCWFYPLIQGKHCQNCNTFLPNRRCRYKKTVPQLLIRWSFQKGYITIPKSSKPERILENADIFNFTISDEDMKALVGFITLIKSPGPNEDERCPETSESLHSGGDQTHSLSYSPKLSCTFEFEFRYLRSRATSLSVFTVMCLPSQNKVAYLLT